MDELDYLILRELQKDGSMSLTIIAKRLRVSIGTIRNRLTRLMEDKTVQIIGRVDPDKVGFHSYARIFISVKPAKNIEPAAKKLSLFPEVSFLAMTSGDYDLEVDVMCKDNDSLVEFVNELSKIDGVYQTKTTIYFKVYKYAQPDLNLLK